MITEESWKMITQSEESGAVLPLELLAHSLGEFTTLRYPLQNPSAFVRAPQFPSTPPTGKLDKRWADTHYH